MRKFKSSNVRRKNETVKTDEKNLVKNIESEVKNSNVEKIQKSRQETIKSDEKNSKDEI